MGRMSERLGRLGRLFFRALGILCALAALAGLAGIVWVIRNWDGRDSAVGLALLLLYGGVMSWCAAHCFSRQRTLIEALDALEGVPLDPRQSDRPPLP